MRLQQPKKDHKTPSRGAPPPSADVAEPEDISIDPNEAAADLLDVMSGARPGKRAGPMRQFADILTSHYPIEMNKWMETWAAVAAASVDKGGLEEALHAATSLEIYALFQERHGIPMSTYEDVERVLHHAAETSRTPRVRGAAAQALGIFALVGTSDDIKLNEVAEWFADMVSRYRLTPTQKSSEGGDFIGFLRGGTLVATALSAQEVADFEKGLAKELWGFAVRFLDHDSPDVRISAGETLAVLLEARRIHGRKTVQQEMEKRWAGVMDRLREMGMSASEGGSRKGLSKTDRREQYAVFRQIVRFIEEGEPIEMKVSVGAKHETLEMSNYSTYFRYEMLRIALQGATNLHLENNPTVGSLLFERTDWGPPAELGGTLGMTVAEIEASRHHGEKGRYQKRDWERRKKYGSPSHVDLD